MKNIAVFLLLMSSACNVESITAARSEAQSVNAIEYKVFTKDYILGAKGQVTKGPFVLSAISYGTDGESCTSAGASLPVDIYVVNDDGSSAPCEPLDLAVRHENFSYHIVATGAQQDPVHSETIGSGYPVAANQMLCARVDQRRAFFTLAGYKPPANTAITVY